MHFILLVSALQRRSATCWPDYIKLSYGHREKGKKALPKLNGTFIAQGRLWEVLAWLILRRKVWTFMQGRLLREFNEMKVEKYLTLPKSHLIVAARPLLPLKLVTALLGDTPRIPKKRARSTRQSAVARPKPKENIVGWTTSPEWGGNVDKEASWDTNIGRTTGAVWGMEPQNMQTPGSHWLFK